MFFSSFLFDSFASEMNLQDFSVSLTRMSKLFICVSRSVTLPFTFFFQIFRHTATSVLHAPILQEV